MRCTICDTRLARVQRLEDDLCSACQHEVRLALGISDPLDSLPDWDAHDER